MDFSPRHKSLPTPGVSKETSSQCPQSFPLKFCLLSQKAVPVTQCSRRWCVMLPSPPPAPVRVVDSTRDAIRVERRKMESFCKICSQAGKSIPRLALLKSHSLDIFTLVIWVGAPWEWADADKEGILKETTRKGVVSGSGRNLAQGNLSGIYKDLGTSLSRNSWISPKAREVISLILLACLANISLCSKKNSFLSPEGRMDHSS